MHRGQSLSARRYIQTRIDKKSNTAGLFFIVRLVPMEVYFADGWKQFSITKRLVVEKTELKRFLVFVTHCGFFAFSQVI